MDLNKNNNHDTKSISLVNQNKYLIPPSFLPALDNGETKETVGMCIADLLLKLLRFLDAYYYTQIY